LLSGKKVRPADSPRHFCLIPRIEVGRFLRKRTLASAMIDISDGLSTDLGHLCEESRVGAEIQAEAIPMAVIGKPVRKVELRFALHGGEDYELLFTAPRGKRVPSRIAGVAVTQIGQVTRGRGVFLEQDGVKRKLPPQGWEHFKKARAV
jgi:thiamine-monophosphate kinase